MTRQAETGMFQPREEGGRQGGRERDKRGEEGYREHMAKRRLKGEDIERDRAAGGRIMIGTTNGDSKIH